MQHILTFIVGVLFGGGIAYLAWLVTGKQNNKSKEDLKSAFNELSQNVLDSQSERFLQLAKSKLETQTKAGEKDLDGKKQLIDASLTKVEKMMSEMEKDRSQAYGTLSNQLKNATLQTESLQKITTDLKSVLSNNKVRGQWGERMAEDILRMAGFVEGVQYEKQQIQENSKARPDFTFKMPDGHVLNMDVKFPLNNYENYLSTDSELEKDKYKKEFLKDAKLRLREIKDRGYINKNTLDYVLLFIPNEQIYSFINEYDRSMLDEALQSKVIICGPNTLYAVLAVVRQAADNFQLEKNSSEILAVLAGFKKEWGRYTEEFDKLEKQLETFGKTFDRVKTTRVNKLEKQIEKVDLAYKDSQLEQLEQK
ncbi:MAG: DNA recombination protein RmuC [Proteobacteria bacterium]|nr:DNA recombination protein RmuC [Pseudomonadota bacterium]